MTANFAQAYEQFNRQAAAHLPTWANALREGAYRVITERGYPTRRDEEWRYLNLKPLTDTEFSWDLPTGVAAIGSLEDRFLKGATNLVFVNGAFAATLSDPITTDKGVVLTPLGEALQRDDGSLRALIEGNGTEDTDLFTALSRAFVYGGLVVELKAGAACTKPLHLIFVTTAGVKPHAAFPQVIVRAGAGAAADVIATHVASAPTVYLNACRTTIFVEKQACVRFAVLQTEANAAFHVSETAVRVAEGATFESFQFARGAAISRQSMRISLEGAHASAQVDGLYLADGEAQTDQRTVIDHKVADATSRQLYKGILKDKARAVFDGKIYVRRDAQRTQAHQLNKNLVLSHTAEIDTKPQLLIDADDVKCSHGAAVGRLDQDEFFYLLSRGIPPFEAQSMLSHAFAIDVVQRIGMPLARASVLKSLQGFFQ